MNIKAFGMDIQVTESAVFVNGKEVYNKVSESVRKEIYKDWEENGFSINLSEMHNYSSGSSLIKPKDESEKEQRMNVIGQNGNDGLHYGFWEDMNNDLMDNNRNEGIWDTDN